MLFAATVASSFAAAIKGRVTDSSNEPLIGATVRIANSSTTAITDIDGNFEIAGLRNGSYSVIAEYVFCKPATKSINLNGIANIDFKLESDSHELQEVVVKRNTEGSIVGLQRNSLLVQTGVSAQLISRTQDSNASEVIKRIPGISIIDDKFVLVRGLSQRYNNVWINRSAVPSSEADSRAFSFDIIYVIYQVFKLSLKIIA